MTRRALLVTGSRVLAGSECERMARDVVSRAVDGVDAVVVGDAQGPDAWALEYASSGRRAFTRRVYALDGWVYDEHFARMRRWRPGTEGCASPLDRNSAMVSELAARARNYPDEWEVRYLALVAGWAQTHGTEHTARLARDAGIRGVTVRFDRDP